METSTEVKSEQVVEGHNNTYIGILAGKSQDYQDGYYSGFEEGARTHKNVKFSESESKICSDFGISPNENAKVGEPIIVDNKCVGFTKPSTNNSDYSAISEPTSPVALDAFQQGFNYGVEKWARNEEIKNLYAMLRKPDIFQIIFPRIATCQLLTSSIGHLFLDFEMNHHATSSIVTIITCVLWTWFKRG